MSHEYPVGTLVRVVDDGGLNPLQRPYLGLAGTVVDDGHHEDNVAFGIRPVQFADGSTVLLYSSKLVLLPASTTSDASQLTEDERFFAYSLLKRGHEVERVLDIIRTLRKGV